MASTHIFSAYDDDLKFLTRRISEMGGLAEQMVGDSVRALVNGDVGTGPEGHLRRYHSRSCRTRSRRQGDHDDRHAASRWRPTCAKSWARSASPPISSASAISARTLPSASSPCQGTGVPAPARPRHRASVRTGARPAQGSARRLYHALAPTRPSPSASATRKSTRCTPRCSARC